MIEEFDNILLTDDDEETKNWDDEYEEDYEEDLGPEMWSTDDDE